MREQNRIKKKKRGGKKKRICVALLVLLLAGVGGYGFYRQDIRAFADESETEAVPGDNQRFVYCQIDQVTGNEIHVKLCEETKDGGYAPLEATADYRILVGTDVVTKLGNVTTFSRLAAGDMLKCLMEETDGEEEIVKVWIVG